MKRTLSALLAAGAVAAAAIAAPTAAEARWGWGGPAILGGLAAGAIIGGALAAPYYYGPRPYYAYGPGPGYSCWRRAWNGWRWYSYRVC